MLGMLWKAMYGTGDATEIAPAATQTSHTRWS